MLAGSSNSSPVASIHPSTNHHHCHHPALQLQVTGAASDTAPPTPILCRSVTLTWAAASTAASASAARVRHSPSSPLLPSLPQSLSPRLSNQIHHHPRPGETETPPNRYPAVRQAVHGQGGGGRHARLHRGARRRRHGLQGALRRRPRRHRRQAPPRRRRQRRPPSPGRGRRRRDHGRLLPGAAAAGPPQPPPRRQAARLRASPPRKARALPPSDPFFLPSSLSVRALYLCFCGLVRFTFGYGWAGVERFRFLVFDHMENRSLKECLHDPLRTPLDWRTRLQVAIDVAAALEYLYYHCDPPVFHVSVNSGTVLMDANFVAKLSDVGVVSHDVRLATTDSFQDRVERRRAGLAFQYGVLVLELVTGQSPGADGELVRWAQDPGSAASVHRMVDADLGGVYDARELRDLVAVARLCTRDRDDRDEGAGVVTIPQIVRYLQGKLERIGCQARFG
uniref:Serine-threonine/tyrosine-protein kinase catalytic domain-containing protein n=3 Tax=Zea mays TaxID=4577 RepID=A0A804Q441_MAIZE